MVFKFCAIGYNIIIIRDQIEARTLLINALINERRENTNHEATYNLNHF